MINKFMKTSLTATAWLVLAASLTHCDKKEEEVEEVPATTSETATFSTDTTSTNIATVETGMIPGSLAVPTAALKLEGNPCDGTDGFFDCQPNLLKVYLEMGKNMVKMVGGVVTNLGPGLEKLGVGAKGSLEIDDGEEFNKVEYDITSSTEYKILLHAVAGPALYLNVKDARYEIVASLDNMPDSDKGGLLRSVIEYTDDTHFTVDTAMSTDDCDPTDVRAPQDFHMIISRAGDLWKGKSMLFMPRWAISGTPTCDMEPTDTSKMGFYTDFVGDDELATASIYFVPYTATSLAQIDTFAVSKLCDNWSGLCNSGYGFGDPNPVSSYGNAFCVDKAASTTTWNAACDSAESDIATPTYSDASLWDLPTEIETPAITMPESL